MIKSFLSWVFGISFLLSAINALIAGNVLFSIPSFIIAVIMIPPVWKYIEDAFNFKLTFKIKALIVCACLILQIGAAIYAFTAVRGLDSKTFEIVIGIAAGIYCIFAAIFNWDFFFEDRRAQFIVDLIGRTGARINFFILGLVIIYFEFLFLKGN